MHPPSDLALIKSFKKNKMDNTAKVFFKIFRAGKYPQGEITKADVEAIATGYDPDYHEAPLTILHDDSSPAYAVVDELKSDNGVLLASFTEMLPEAFEMNKRYKRPSIEIALYDDKKYLRAVTLTNFPQVKGLDRIKFEENSSIFFSEGLTINLTKGIKMFNEKLIKLAESLSLSISDYQTEGDLIDAAQSKLTEIKTELGVSSAKLSSLNLSLSKYEEAGITIEKFNELKSNNENLQKEIKAYEKERVDGLINTALQTKDILSSFSSAEAFGNSIRNFAERISYDEAKKFVEGLKTKIEGNPLLKKKPDGKEYKYEDILDDPSLAKYYGKEELAAMRKNSVLFK